LAAYKRQPELIAAGFDNLTSFGDILAAIPLTPAQPNDLLVTPDTQSLEDRMRHFITAYYLLPHDALILAEAERLGVTAILHSTAIGVASLSSTSTLPPSDLWGLTSSIGRI